MYPEKLANCVDLCRGLGILGARDWSFAASVNSSEDQKKRSRLRFCCREECGSKNRGQALPSRFLPGKSLKVLAISLEAFGSLRRKKGVCLPCPASTPPLRLEESLH